jgi:DNA-binding NtrC family response regulator
MNKKILIVDDDMSFVNKILDSCPSCKHTYAIADSIKRAKYLLSNDSFDIILANVKVPGGNSMELKSDSSNELKNTSFLFMSNLDSDYENVNNSGEKCYYKYDFDKSLKVYLENV